MILEAQEWHTPEETPASDAHILLVMDDYSMHSGKYINDPRCYPTFKDRWYVHSYITDEYDAIDKAQVLEWAYIKAL